LENSETKPYITDGNFTGGDQPHDYRRTTYNNDFSPDHYELGHSIKILLGLYNDNNELLTSTIV